jgi:hypothetical protein
VRFFLRSCFAHKFLSFFVFRGNWEETFPFSLFPLPSYLFPLTPNGVLVYLSWRVSASSRSEGVGRVRSCARIMRQKNGGQEKNSSNLKNSQNKMNSKNTQNSANTQNSQNTQNSFDLNFPLVGNLNQMIKFQLIKG